MSQVTTSVFPTQDEVDAANLSTVATLRRRGFDAPRIAKATGLRPPHVKRIVLKLEAEERKLREMHAKASAK